MKPYDWNSAKNLKLKAERSIGFEDILTAIEQGNVLDNFAHPNQDRYPKQRVLVVVVEDYAFLVPFTEDDTKIFLKTIYPSRKFTKVYLKERREQ